MVKIELLFLDDNDLNGDLDEICAPLNAFIVADCGVGSGDAASVEISCSCCDECCHINEPCNDADWIPNADPTWQSDYQRHAYRFGESNADVYVTAQDAP